MEGVNYSPYSGQEEFYKTFCEAHGEAFAEGCMQLIRQKVAGGMPVRIPDVVREQIVASRR